MTALQQTDRITRIGLVTASLSATGGIVGALCAASAVTIIAIAAQGVGAFTHGAIGIVGMSAAAGAVAGTIAAPLLAWGLLRRVPLGRAILATAVGTVVGAVAGEWLRPFNPYVRTLPGVITGAFVGFLFAGVALHLLARQLSDQREF